MLTIKISNSKPGKKTGLNICPNGQTMHEEMVQLIKHQENAKPHPNHIGHISSQVKETLWPIF